MEDHGSDEKKQPDDKVVISKEKEEGEDTPSGDSGGGGDDNVDKNKDKDKNDPDLYDELAQALFSAINIYGLADLRELARRNEGKLKGDDQDIVNRVLTLPCSDVEIARVFIDNLSELKKVMQTEVYVSAMERLDNDLLREAVDDDDDDGKMKKQPEATHTKSSGGEKKSEKPFRTVCEGVVQKDRQQQQSGDDPATLEVFDDKDSTKQLVYAIVVDRQKKLFKVVFRGSVTLRDWAVDSNSNILKRKSNPLFEKSAPTTIPQGKKAGIHRGFYNYMFEVKKKDDDKNKYETIHAHLDDLRQEYPDFTLCVTGHSLGAALATLFTYQSAMDDRFTEKAPISCFAFASPRLGNDKFVRAFQELQHTGKIRFLLIHNKEDVVPMMPLRTCMPPPATYEHVGEELRLFRDGTYKCLVPPVCKNGANLRWRNTMLAIKFCFQPPAYGSCSRFWLSNIVKYHGCEEYMNRLESVSKELHGISMRDLKSKGGRYSIKSALGL